MSKTYGAESAAVKPLSGIFMLALLALLLAGGPAFAREIRIVGFGDSLMAGYRLDENDAFPAQLQAALHKDGFDVTVTNAGVSGDTTSGGLERLNWSVPDGTDLVILELGANDALRGIPPEITERNLAKMIEDLKARGIGVLLAGMLAPPNMGSDYEAAFNPIYPSLAKKYDVPLYPFFLEGVAAQKDLQLDDGMHPNPEGVKRIVNGILPAVENIIKNMNKQVEEK